ERGIRDSINDPLVGLAMKLHADKLQNLGVLSNSRVFKKFIPDILVSLYSDQVLRRTNYFKQAPVFLTKQKHDSYYVKYYSGLYQRFIHLLNDSVELKGIHVDLFHKFLQAVPFLV